MNKFKKIMLTAIAIVAVSAVVAVAKPEVSSAQMNNDLNSFITLNGLFTGYNAADLAGLIAVDNIFDGGMGGTMGTSDLSDLIVLNGLFNGYNAADLAGLIAVNNIV